MKLLLKNNKYIAIGAISLVVCFLFVVLMSRMSFAGPEGQTAGLQDLQLVWSADYGKGEQVFVSSFKKNEWSVPVQVSNSTDFVFHPAISVGKDGKQWILWVNANKKGKMLYFATAFSGHWSKPEVIDTGLKENRNITVIVDADNTPWIAWTAADKKYSDVFWSRWDGKKWEKPVKAHPDNNVPDLHPELILDKTDHLILSWQTFVQGKYVSLFKRWNGKRWEFVPADEGRDILNQMNFVRRKIPSLPAFTPERHKGRLFVKTREETFSIPLSSF